jgi:hypothetical protein
MPIEPNIALGVRPLELANPLAQYGQLAQIQAAQNQNAMAQLQMREAEATAQERNALRALNPNAPDYESQLFKVNPQLGIQYRKEQSAAEASKAATAASKASTAKNEFELSQKKLEHGFQSLGSAPTPQAAVNAILDGVKQGYFDQATADAEIAKIPTDIIAYRDYRANKILSLMDAKDQLAHARDQERLGLERQRVGFEGTRVGLEKQRVGLEGQRVGMEGERLTLAKKEDLRKEMGLENLPPKEIQKREAALPQATSAIKGFEAKSDSFVKDLEKLRDHPGLSQITGIIAGRAPAVTAEGRAAQALYDKVVAKGGFQALQDLRDASKTGGALGNVSNQEGKQLTASFSAIDRRQDAKDVKAAIDEAIGSVQGAKTRMREAYDATYQYKSGKPTESSGGGVIDFGSLK